MDEDYVPIDWQLDFKSGWRWPEPTWYRDVSYGDVPGVDVKVPWELARMQHLPQLALAAALASGGAGGFLPAQRYAREFRNQVLDFLAANPPRFGVNWTTAMDVSIRVANWLVAYDLFVAAGTEFDQPFESVFRRAILEHGMHLASNLEWNAELRGNHYLADVVGLLYVSAYLPRSKATDAWLAFAVQQLVAEVDSQFGEDGANFEASTCYHRLSAEMAVHAVSIILGLDREKREALESFDARLLPRLPGHGKGWHTMRSPRGASTDVLPRSLLDKVERMAEFVIDITKPNGRVPQIGDNDSGRFLKLIPIASDRPVGDIRAERASLAAYRALPDEARYWDEDHLDHRHLVGSINGLFQLPEFSSFSGARIEADLVASTAHGTVLRSYRGRGARRSESVRIGDHDLRRRLMAEISALPEDQRRVCRIGIPPSTQLEPPALRAYPDFGVFVARSDRLYLAIRCGPIGQNGFGGHAHNDQLSLELSVDGEDWIRDPGTYLYTPLPHRRNEYRAQRAHFGPRLVGPEPARLDLGLFRLGPESAASCLYWGAEGFIGRLTSGKRSVTCSIAIDPDAVVLTYGLESWSFAEVQTEPTWKDWLPDVPFSPGYGIVEQSA